MTTTTRRAVLGAIALAPVAAIPAIAAAAPGNTEWKALIAACHRAKEANEAFYRDVWEPAYLASKRAIEALPHPTATDRVAVRAHYRVDEIETEMGGLSDGFCDTLEAAIRHPVSSIAELNEKMEMVTAEDGFDLSCTIPAITADIARLAAAGRA